MSIKERFKASDNGTQLIKISSLWFCSRIERASLHGGINIGATTVAIIAAAITAVIISLYNIDLL